MRDIIDILYTLPGIIVGFAFHEFAHAYVADKLGDPTPRSQGRLTLSPMSHIDPLGLLFIAIVGFGWAKPVQTNPRYYRNPGRDDLLVSLAGPVMNLILAIIFTAVLRVLYIASPGFSGGNIMNITNGIVISAISINIVLFLFNLLPIPPLDGFHILARVTPMKHNNIIYQLERYGTIILIVLIITKVTDKIIGVPGGIIFGALLRVFHF